GADRGRLRRARGSDESPVPLHPHELVLRRHLGRQQEQLRLDRLPLPRPRRLRRADGMGHAERRLAERYRAHGDHRQRVRRRRRPVGRPSIPSAAAALSGLQPGTTYHDKLVATNSSGTTSASNDEPFATTASNDGTGGGGGGSGGTGGTGGTGGPGGTGGTTGT